MSLYNTFRLFVVSLIIVLSTIDTSAAFTLHRTTSGEPSRDLAQEESVIVEVKHENKPPVSAQTIISNEKNSDILKISKAESNKTLVSNNTKSRNLVLENQVTDTNVISTVINDESTTEILTSTNVEVKDEKSLATYSLPYDLNSNETKKITSNARQNEFIQTTEITTETSTLGEDFDVTTSFESVKLPTWKKYITIDRKRQPTTKNDVKARKKKEEMTKSETKRLRVALQDTFTSDIPSLEQLKHDLLYPTSKEQSFDVRTESLNLFTTYPNESYETTTTTILSTEDITSSTRWETIESIRAGFLDLSEKVKKDETLTAKETSDFKSGPKGTLRATFELENIESDIPEAKSQGQLNDDTIKEELLKEKVMNENEENVKRFDTNDEIITETLFKNIQQQQQQGQITNSTTDEKLSVKPINGDKIKNISLYSVNPNYKPLKKIEVQPPKQFVRDPDDNAWRNESLNSLGIVFKSNNSSKPFTQVLKNKTEAVLNSIPEKDSKNDIPDLKERLQKMAEKRKSKRKKTDSLGNVVYFDYEESSGSREHVSKEELSSITSSPETVTNVNGTNSNSSDTPAVITTSMISTTGNIRGNMRDLYTTKKFKKFFNVPEYYDTTEEDDNDYLEMAKIDIKKFSTSPKTTPTTTVPDIPRNRGINRFASTISPERKATIQYFPPLTTQKVNLNDYDNGFKLKVNSFTINTEPPKEVLPVPLDTLKAPENTFQFNHLNTEVPNSFTITNKPSFEKQFYPTQLPHTTQTAFTLLNDGGTFNKDSYVIRHYKDFINEAAKHNEFDKNLEYIPYTQSPEKEVTKQELIKYVTEKAKVNMDQEYDYETQFRKDVLQRFVDNFNQNSERFKSEFPILFNNSVIHRDTQNGREVASSRAFMRGLYNTDFKPKYSKDDANNENITVELSPSYELHYYMPEQEEKEEIVQQPVTLPYQYRL